MGADRQQVEGGFVSVGEQEARAFPALPTPWSFSDDWPSLEHAFPISWLSSIPLHLTHLVHLTYLSLPPPLFPLLPLPGSRLAQEMVQTDKAEQELQKGLSSWGSLKASVPVQQGLAFLRCRLLNSMVFSTSSPSMSKCAPRLTVCQGSCEECCNPWAIPPIAFQGREGGPGMKTLVAIEMPLRCPSGWGGDSPSAAGGWPTTLKPLWHCLS